MPQHGDEPLYMPPFPPTCRCTGSLQSAGHLHGGGTTGAESDPAGHTSGQLHYDDPSISPSDFRMADSKTRLLRQRPEFLFDIYMTRCYCLHSKTTLTDSTTFSSGLINLHEDKPLPQLPIDGMGQQRQYLLALSIPVSCKFQLCFTIIVAAHF